MGSFTSSGYSCGKARLRLGLQGETVLPGALHATKGLPMNNADLAEKLAEANGLSKIDARKIVDGVFAAIADAAAQGDEIALNGFGKFKVKASAEREGRNPSTGAAIKIAASKKLTFAAAKAVKDRLNG
jgi:DNA-binding protein HU-beta